MKVGTSLTITMLSRLDKETDAFHCKIIDIVNRYLVIDYPVDLQANQPIPIKLNSNIQIEFMEKGNIYRFNTVVTKLEHSPLLAFLVPIPEMEQIKKIQRRKYVRIEFDADVAVHGSDLKFHPFTTVTKDISGGGMAIILPPHTTLEGINEVEVYLVLKSTYSDFKYIHTRAKIIRITCVNEVKIASVKFLFSDEHKRQKIINYCFEIQREQLKQQLL